MIIIFYYLYLFEFIFFYWNNYKRYLSYYLKYYKVAVEVTFLVGLLFNISKISFFVISIAVR